MRRERERESERERIMNEKEIVRKKTFITNRILTDFELIKITYENDERESSF